MKTAVVNYIRESAAQNLFTARMGQQLPLACACALDTIAGSLFLLLCTRKLGFRCSWLWLHPSSRLLWAEASELAAETMRLDAIKGIIEAVQRDDTCQKSRDVTVAGFELDGCPLRVHVFCMPQLDGSSSFLLHLRSIIFASRLICLGMSF